MTIKQQGGIFGRNPTFNDVTSSKSVVDNITIDGNTISTTNTNGALVLEPNGSAPVTINATQPRVRLIDTDASGTPEAEISASGGDLILTADRDNEKSDTLIRFLIDGGEKWQINSTGNLVVSNSGNGIDFSATSGTGTSELFDDYEEGEHTAVITATTSGTITLDSTNNKLAYTKVGRVVHVHGTIVVDSVSSPVGVAKITLPFTASNSLGGLAERSPPSIWIQGSVSKNTTDFIGYVAEGSNQISVGTGDSTNFLSLGANELQAASSIYISVTYTAS